MNKQITSLDYLIIGLSLGVAFGLITLLLYSENITKENCKTAMAYKPVPARCV